MNGQSESDRKALTTIAHDIKAPLSAIIDLLNVIDKGYVDDPKKIMELVGRAREKSEHVLHMIDDILDYTILADKKLMKRERIDITSVLRESLSTMTFFTEKNNISLVHDIHTQPKQYIWGNFTFLLRVFNNLLMNAIKYNKEHGSIIVSCEQISENNLKKIKIKVSDTGVGIPDEDINRVFDIFERGKNAKRNIDGSIGLGLSLVKQIIRDHDGTIELNSTLLVGTTVTVTLPLIK